MAGKITAMILNTNEDDIVDCIRNPIFLTKMVGEAMDLLSGPPSTSSRLSNSPGFDPDPEPIPLDGSDSDDEGGHDNDQKAL